MLFRTKIEPRCAYCTHSSPLDEERMTCLKKGVVSCGGSCRKFSYDPLKRKPSRPAGFQAEKWKDEDFSL
jgi:hypothetical protein